MTPTTSKKRDAAISARTTLLALRLPGPLSAMARSVPSDQFSSPALAKLRDALTAYAATLREQKQDARAAKVAAANKLVRRLERAARKGGKA